MPVDAPSQPPETCPGCGAVLAPVPDGGPVHAGASPSCSRLFEVTVRGLREDARAHNDGAAVIALADAAYDAQHPVDGDADRLRAALHHLGAPEDVDLRRSPSAWRTTVADVAADLDVIDLPVLVESWARTVREDWTVAPATRE